jgi:hypothetical protein
MSKVKKGKNENLTYQTEPISFFKPVVSFNQLLTFYSKLEVLSRN